MLSAVVVAQADVHQVRDGVGGALAFKGDEVVAVFVARSVGEQPVEVPPFYRLVVGSFVLGQQHQR